MIALNDARTISRHFVYWKLNTLKINLRNKIQMQEIVKVHFTTLGSIPLLVDCFCPQGNYQLRSECFGTGTIVEFSIKLFCDLGRLGREFPLSSGIRVC